MAYQVTLQAGDYVSTKGMTEHQAKQVADAFIAAGAKPGSGYPYEADSGVWDFLLWHADDGLTDRAKKGGTGMVRHLTIDQVLNATNATQQPKEDTMTTDPIATLKQARATRDEAEEAYQQALAEAREYLGEGFALTEVGSDAPLVDGEDMTDPANWREGDVLVAGRGGLDISAGNKYVLRADRDGDLGIIDDAGDRRYNLSGFRFHRRPN